MFGSGIGGVTVAKKQVSRLTKTQVVVDGSNYRKDNGNLVGRDRWSSAGIAPWNAQHEQTLEVQTLRRKSRALIKKVSELDPNKLNAEQFKKLLDVYNEIKQ